MHGYQQPPDQYAANAPDTKGAFAAGAQGQLAALQKGQFDFKWRFLFFSCALCVFAAGVLSLIDLTLTFQWGLTCVSEVYVTMFGLIMVILDFPRSDERADKLRMAISKYLRFLTLFFGRGMAYIFLSTMTYSALHDNKINNFLGYILGGYIFVVGVISVYVGVQRSRQLTGLRGQLQANPTLMDQFTRHGNGMTVPQFQEMARSVNYTFDDDAAEFIFDTLQGYPTRPGDTRLLQTQHLQQWIKDTGITLF